jgi:hypothetical protein
MDDLDELLGKSETEIDSGLLNIRDHIWSAISGIWHMDRCAKGVYEKPTIYIWVYKDCANSVIKEVMKLYPNIFYLFEPNYKNKDKIGNKIILRINQTNTPIPIEETEEKKSNCVII